MLKRAIWGAVFVAILVSAYLYSVETAWLLSVVISVLGFIEFSKITKSQKGIEISRLWWGSITLLGIDMAPLDLINLDISFKLSALNLVLIPVIAISELFRKKEKPVENIAFGFLSVIYPSLIYYSYQAGFSTEENIYFGTTIIGFFILIWSNDTFAYLSGRFFGKHKLFERISPKKTWEGSIGGAFASIAISQLLAIFHTQFSPLQWAILSVICVVFGALGDLVESLIKRNYGIKDSGNVIPGHGGILDRFDATLLASPILYFFIHYIF